MDLFGIYVGFVTLLLVGFGFPLVIISERVFGTVFWPYLVGMGLISIILSMFLHNDWASVIAGVIGAVFVWGSTELKNQAVRARLGWFPCNPNKKKLPFGEVIRKWKAPSL